MKMERITATERRRQREVLEIQRNIKIRKEHLLSKLRYMKFAEKFYITALINLKELELRSLQDKLK